jgi:hypothetical protein
MLKRPIVKGFDEVIEIRSGRNQKEVLNPNGKYPVLGSAGKIMGYADKYICEKGTLRISINSPQVFSSQSSPFSSKIRLR